MTSKVVGAIILIGVILGAIFLIKFIPAYTGAHRLHRYFNECMSNFDNYGYRQCRIDMKNIIEEENLDLTVDEIYMDMKVLHPDSVVRAEWDETLDFFGVFQYEHHFKLEHKGKPPMRD